jgi:hypothetical protein
VRLEVVDAAEVGAVAERPVHRRRGDAEHALDLVEQLERVAPGWSSLLTKVSTGQPRMRHTSKSFSVCGLDALGRVDHHDDAVDGEQRAVGVLAEVLVAGRVEQRDVVALQLELERRGADRDAALLLHLHPVGGGVPLGLAAAHRAGQLDRAGVEQQLLGERRLAGVGVGDDREGAAAGDLAARGARCPRPRPSGR